MWSIFHPHSSAPSGYDVRGQGGGAKGSCVWSTIYPVLTFLQHSAWPYKATSWPWSAVPSQGIKRPAGTWCYRGWSPLWWYFCVRLPLQMTIEWCYFGVCWVLLTFRRDRYTGSTEKSANTQLTTGCCLFCDINRTATMQLIWQISHPWMWISTLWT